jgi:glucose/arabinose dehydrogenase
MWLSAPVLGNARVIVTRLIEPAKGPALDIVRAALFYALCGTVTQAATLPSGFTETLIASGLSNPTAMAIAPDGRLFVCQQGGQLRVIKGGALLSTPFLTLNVNSSGERGLLGVAFDPAFDTNHFVYVYYTMVTSPIHNRVSRFTANGDVALPGSEVAILDLEALSATNHNGGAIHFGIDGKLYVAVGDNAVGSNAQTLSNRLGKLLRINSDGTIPTDNPFYPTAVGSNRAIWALGLRNPFTFSVQPLSGRLFINDVGQNTWEEINEGVAGGNYGWPVTEGPTSDPRFDSPLFAYDRRTTGDCAITGGSFYNPITEQFPAEYVGAYFFADFCGGWIRRLDPDGPTTSAFAAGISFPVDLQVSNDGSLFYLARGGGANTGVLYRISFVAQPPSNLVVSGLSAPRGAASGAVLRVTDKTTNQGSGNSGASETGIWLSTNKALGSDTWLAARSVPGLAPGESSRGTSTVTLPVVGPGTYFLLAQADSNSRVDESHEGDNVRVRQLVVGPDLRPAIASQPASPTSTAPTTIAVTTSNVGFDTAAASVTRLYRSLDATIGPGDMLLREWAIPPLNPSQASANTVTVTLPSGTYFLLAVVDVTNEVMEANETQNVKKVKLVVQ